MVTATFDELVDRFAALSDRKRIELLLAHKDAVREGNPVLHQSLMQIEHEKRRAAAIEMDTQRHRKRAMTWLAKQEQSALKAKRRKPRQRATPLERSPQRSVSTVLAEMEQRCRGMRRRCNAMRRQIKQLQPKPVSGPVIALLPPPQPPQESPMETTLNGHREPVELEAFKQRRKRNPLEPPTRLAGKLDALIQDVRHMIIEPPEEAPAEALPEPERPRVEWNRTHGEITPEESAPAAPLSPLGAGEQSADAHAAQAGGSQGGFTLQRPNAWDVVAGQGAALSDLREFLEDVDQNPALRAAATLRAMDRLRDALLLVEETEAAETLVELPLQTVALLARQLLSRLR